MSYTVRAWQALGVYDSWLAAAGLYPTGYPVPRLGPIAPVTFATGVYGQICSAEIGFIESTNNHKVIMKHRHNQAEATRFLEGAPAGNRAVMDESGWVYTRSIHVGDSRFRAVKGVSICYHAELPMRKNYSHGVLQAEAKRYLEFSPLRRVSSVWDRSTRYRAVEGALFLRGPQSEVWIVSGGNRDAEAGLEPGFFFFEEDADAESGYGLVGIRYSALQAKDEEISRLRQELTNALPAQVNKRTQELEQQLELREREVRVTEELYRGRCEAALQELGLELSASEEALRAAIQVLKSSATRIRNAVGMRELCGTFEVSNRVTRLVAELEDANRRARLEQRWRKELAEVDAKLGLLGACTPGVQAAKIGYLQEQRLARVAELTGAKPGAKPGPRAPYARAIGEDAPYVKELNNRLWQAERLRDKYRAESLSRKKEVKRLNALVRDVSRHSKIQLVHTINYLQREVNRLGGWQRFAVKEGEYGVIASEAPGRSRPLTGGLE